MTTWVSGGCQTVFFFLLYSKYSKSYIFFVRPSLNLRGLGLKIYFWKVQFSRRMIIMTNASITGNFLSAFGVSSMRIGGNYLRGNNWIKENIARIAKAASNSSCPLVQSYPVLTTMTTMTTVTVATMMTMATLRKLEVIWGCWRLYTRKLEVVWSHITSDLLV